MTRNFRSLRAVRAAAFLLLAAVAYGQSLTGTIAGNVTDATGAVVPGATIRIINATTRALVFTGTSDAEGAYLAPALPAGRYNLTFEAPSFRKIEISNVTLQVDQRARVDAALQTGEVTETVTISGETFGQLERDSSSQDEVINTSQVQNLPLPSRNVLNLLPLIAGVSSGGNATGLNTRQISVNGSRTLNTEITVDGVSVLNGTTGEVTRLPSTEALRELKVLTSGYSAEYGRTSGGYVNAVVDSGTRAYRGGVYEYFRNEALNANNYFRNLRNEERPVDRYNQFGVRFGGPLLVPRFGEGGPVFTQNRDRTFFFFNYEGLRRLVPASPISTVPDERYRSGDFSQVLAGPDGIAGTNDDGFLRDPRTTAPCGLVAGQPVRTGCFPNNIIPQDRFDPAARRILALIPLPSPGLPPVFDAVSNRLTSNYINVQTNPRNENEYTLRLDHNAGGGNTRLYGRFTYYKIDDFTTGAVQIPGPLDPGASTESPTFIPGYQTALGLTHTFSPRLILEANFGFLRVDQLRVPQNRGLDFRNILGIERLSADVAPRINISNFTSFGIGANATSREVTNTFMPSGSLSVISGNHSLKFGAQLRKNQFNVFNAGGNFAGVYNITGGATAPTSGGGAPAVNAFAEFLLGNINNATYTIPQPLVGRRNHNLGVFAQDDWRVTQRLTLNLGLRWEYETPITVVNDIYARLDNNGRLLVAGRNASRTLDLETDYNNFAPRVGFAYSFNDRTVLRGAFGSFFGQIFSNLGGAVNFPSFTAAATFQNLGPGLAQPFTLSQGIPLIAVQDFSDPLRVERTATPANPLNTGAQFSETSPLPYTMLWNFGIQRELGSGIVVDASYVGSRGVHLPLSLPVNQPPFELATELARLNSGIETQRARPNPNVAGFSPFFNAGTSSYHSLQLKGSRQFSRSVSFLTTYTWSKSIDDGSGLFNSSQPNGLDQGQFPRFFRYLDRGPSAFDRRHSYTLALQYTMPKFAFLPDAFGRALSNFQINPILLWRTGLPDTITQSNTNPLATQQRPNVANNNSIYADELTPEGQGIRYLVAPIIGNVPNASFPYAPSGPVFTGTGAARRQVLPLSIGTLGRNTVYQPSEFNIDLSISRRIALSERFALQFRAEAFNALNHTNFNGPDVSLAVQTDAAGNVFFNSPTFGLITGARPSRFMQLVLRLDF